MNKTMERALLARPVALAIGAAAAAWLVPNLRQGSLIFYIAGIFSGTCLLLWGVRRVPRLSRVVPIASPVVGLLGWGVLATFTGGLKSPFVAAYFLEILLAVITTTRAGVLWVTGFAVAVVVLVSVPYGVTQGLPLLILECLFVAVIGGLGANLAGRRRATEVAMRIQREELGDRLEALQRELEDERVISKAGESVARLAHGLKNAVHSLRGFVSLIEPQLEAGGGSRAAVAGLHAAIDDLEKLARLALSESLAEAAAGPSPGAETSRSALLAAVVEDARRELTTASPDVLWEVVEGEGASEGRVAMSAAPLMELLVILMRNAVEAMHGEGRGRVVLSITEDRCLVSVADEGEGVDAERLAQIFQPGFTTKEKGSGFGLFLARRIVEDHGGRLEIGPGAGGGAVVEVELPRVIHG